MIISFLRVTALIKNPEYSNINGVFLESKGKEDGLYLYGARKNESLRHIHE